MELRGCVEIGLPTVKAGVEIKARANMDTPLSLKIKMDPEKSKFTVKVQEPVIQQQKRNI